MCIASARPKRFSGPKYAPRTSECPSPSNLVYFPDLEHFRPHTLLKAQTQPARLPFFPSKTSFITCLLRSRRPASRPQSLPLPHRHAEELPPWPLSAFGGGRPAPLSDHDSAAPALCRARPDRVSQRVVSDTLTTDEKGFSDRFVCVIIQRLAELASPRRDTHGGVVA